jgi:hypothetical protein
MCKKNGTGCKGKPPGEQPPETVGGNLLKANKQVRASSCEEKCSCDIKSGEKNPEEEEKKQEGSEKEDGIIDQIMDEKDVDQTMSDENSAKSDSGVIQPKKKDGDKE